MTIGYNGVKAAGDDNPWPPAAGASAPSTWATAELAEVPGFAPRYAFTGLVQRPAGDGLLEGIGDVTVQLILSEDDRLRLADTTQTDQGGYYRLDYQGFPPESFIVRELNPPGVVSTAANAGLGGSVAAADLLVYTIDPDATPEDTSFADGRFIDALSPAAPPVLRQHYLIVYAAPVTEDDLAALVDARRAQGFRVLARSTADIAETTAGRDIGEKIHNWLEAEWQAVEPEPVYALLVGRGDKIPPRDIGWLDNDHRDPRLGTYYPAWPTDWYYADLDSSWDADGDGYFGEFLGCAPGDTYPVAAGAEVEEGNEDGLLDCPEAGSLAREGPWGALRETSDDFKPEIALGRLPLNGPGEVRRAIETILAGELGGAEKRRAIVAGAFWEYEGQSWSETQRASVLGGDPLADPWIRQAGDGERPLGFDAGEAMEQNLVPRLQPVMTELTRLYEATSPSGDPTLGPTRLVPTAPLTPQSLAQHWLRGAGLVHLAGLGAPGGLFQARWTRDWDNDGQIDQAAAPTSCAGQPGPGGQVGPPCLELEVARFFDAGSTTPGPGAAPVVVANAGASANIAWQWDGVDGGGSVIDLRYGPSASPVALFGRGAIAGWFGSLGPIQPGAMDGFQARLAEQIAGRSLRLGDAAAVALGDLARGAPYDPRTYGVVFLGDPAAPYWGTPADTRGAWAQDGGDWRASGGSAYAGPVVPEAAWTLRDPVLGGAAAIGGHSDLVLAGAGSVARYAASGALVGRGTLPPGVTARFAPALAESGVYVAAGSSLFIFDASLANRTEVRLPTGATPSGAPRAGSDGTVWMPTTLGMLRVDGAGRVAQVSLDPVRGAPAWLPTGELVWSTADGRVLGYLVSPAGEGRLREILRRDQGDLTAPAVSPEGTLYVGSTDGRIYAVPAEGRSWQLDAGGAVQARPVIGRDGKVYVATTGGRVSAFASERSDLLWTARLSAAVTAGGAVDGSQLYLAAGQNLHALDLATGLVNWTAALGGALDERSSPVIGPDRTLYVTRVDQALVAIREAGWLAAPSDVVLETSASGAVIRWRDNSADEAGFRVTLCDGEDRCVDGGTAAGATHLDLRRLPWSVGTRFTAHVQALARTEGGGLVSASNKMDRQSPAAPAAPAADTTHDSDFAVSAPRAGVPVRPTAPTGFMVAAEASDALALEWRWDGDAAALRGFDISRRVGQVWQRIAVLDGDARDYLDRELMPDTRYEYQVVAVGAGGVSDAVAATGSTWPQSLGSVTNLRAEVDPRGVRLRWQENNVDEREVVIERLAPGTAVFEVLGRLGAGASHVTFMDHHLLVPGVYSYRVKSVGAEGDSAYAGLTVRFARTEERTVWLPMMYQFRRR